MRYNFQFITSRFYRYDCIPYNFTDCYRIITNEGTYFFYKNQFIDVSVLDKLDKGDIIHIGSHALNDGTFWLHWLVSGKGDLAIRNKLHYAIPHPSTLILPFLILIGFWLDLEFITLLLATGLFLILVWCICSTLYRLINLVLPKQIFLRQRYHRFKNGDFCFMKISFLEHHKTFNCSSTDLPVYEGIATNIDYQLTSLTSQKIIFFDFNGVRLCFEDGGHSSIASDDYASDLIPVVYYFCHPTFIASGDKLSLIFENNKIQGIINHTDGSSYLIPHCSWISKQKAKTLLRNWYFYTIFAPIAFLLLQIIIYPIKEFDFIMNGFLWIISGAQIIPLLLLLFYTLFSYLNDRSYAKRVLKWLYQTTGHWPKEL